MKIKLNPITKKRLARFKETKRAYYSCIFLIILYTLSLSSELICNSNPLYVRFEGKSYFPFLFYYPENTFTGSGNFARPDYKKLKNHPAFVDKSENFMIFPFFSFGPYEIIKPDQLEISNKVKLTLNEIPRMANVNIKKDYTIYKYHLFDLFINNFRKQNDIVKDNDKEKKYYNKNEIIGNNIKEFWQIPKELEKNIICRFENKNCNYYTTEIKSLYGLNAIVSLSNYKPRTKSPKSIRLTFTEKKQKQTENISIVFNNKLEIIKGKEIWDNLIKSENNIVKDKILEKVKNRFVNKDDKSYITINNKEYLAYFQKQDIFFPFPPAKNHPMGIDSAGRDVFARILYGLRTSMTFGLILVICSMVLGIFFGAIQGYYAGIVDILGQRFTEIWSALPFLYVMILLGSVYGRSFYLLLFCYGIFNWIGISYYTRAEFLRLRKQSFVEAAKCMGLKTRKIIFRHILPNGLVPIITFFPFSLVGAIGSLAALDYLGFGLPPPTPSWGELLAQAQTNRSAWWLIGYPSIILFIVMLAGVFVGEGIRNAYDPKRFSVIE